MLKGRAYVIGRAGESEQWQNIQRYADSVVQVSSSELAHMRRTLWTKYNNSEHMLDRERFLVGGSCIEETWGNRDKTEFILVRNESRLGLYRTLKELGWKLASPLPLP